MENIIVGNKENFKEKLNTFLTYNEFGKSLVWEDNLFDHIKSFLDPTLKLERLPDESKVAISTCDYLIADESLDLQGDKIHKHLSSTGGELLAADLRDNATLIHHSSKKLTSLFAHIVSKTLLG
jgi:hypothetical protein